MTKLIQPGARGADYSYARPNLVLLAGAGYEYLARYCSPNWTHLKNITRAERDAIFAAGLCLMIVFESSTMRPYGGRPAGLIDGANARAFCEQVIDMPYDFEIYIAFDTDTTPGNLILFTEYARGFQQGAGPYPLGAYGDRDIIEALSELGIIRRGWQANASWWSRFWAKIAGRGHVHIQQGVQSDDHSVDTNKALLPFPAWDGKAAPTPPPVQEDDMTISLLAPSDSPARYFAETDSAGRALSCQWTGPGDAVGSNDRIRAFEAGGLKVISNISQADLKTVRLDGVLPPGVAPEVFANADEIRATPAAVDPEARSLAQAALATVGALVQKLRSV